MLYGKLEMSMEKLELFLQLGEGQVATAKIDHSVIYLLYPC